MKLRYEIEYTNTAPVDDLIVALQGTAQGDDVMPSGQYAVAWEKDGAVFLARDRLGCNKLFYCLVDKNKVLVVSRISRALELGVNIDNLASVPAGQIVKLTEASQEILCSDPISNLPIAESFDLRSFQANVSQDLNAIFVHLAKFRSDHAFVVCLSGGLDSSIVASHAYQYLPNVTAFSFSFADLAAIKARCRGDTLEKIRGLSEDFNAANKVAQAIGINLCPVFRSREAISSAVQSAVSLCQDWRDFNVHCAMVNLFLAQDIRAYFPGRKVTVLTGDLMNEYVCDYHEEEVDGVVYYPQPRMDKQRRRRFFVRGLDAGDREVGVFSAYGLNVVQPYSVVGHHYMSVPGLMLDQANIKMTLNAYLLPESVRAVVSQVKRRAQVGDKEGGVLGGFHRLGFDQGALRQIWINGLPSGGRGDFADDIIHFGRYRTTTKAS